MANGLNDDAVTEGEAPVPVELSPESQAALQEAVDAAAAEAARKAREELEPKLRAEQEEKERLAAQEEADRAAAEAEAARIVAEEEAKRLAEEEAARLEDEAKQALVEQQTPRVLGLLRQRYFRGKFGSADIDAVLAKMEPDAVKAATETWVAELDNLVKQAREAPEQHHSALGPLAEAKPRRRR